MSILLINCPKILKVIKQDIAVLVIGKRADPAHHKHGLLFYICDSLVLILCYQKTSIRLFNLTIQLLDRVRIDAC